MKQCLCKNCLLRLPDLSSADWGKQATVSQGGRRLCKESWDGWGEVMHGWMLITMFAYVKKGEKKSKPQYWQNMDAEWDRTTIGRTFYQNASLFKQIPLQLFSSEQIRKNMARKRPRNFINFYLTFSFLGKLKKPAPPVCLVFIYHQSSIMWCWINRFTALKDKIKLSPQVGNNPILLQQKWSNLQFQWLGMWMYWFSPLRWINVKYLVL